MRCKVNRRGDGRYSAHLEPVEGVYVGAIGADEAKALHQAARLLDRALDRPELQAVLPPGTIAAVKLLRGATAAIQRGELQHFLSDIAPKHARAVVNTLRKVLSW